jgi:hypothetical protein
LEYWIPAGELSAQHEHRRHHRTHRGVSLPGLRPQPDETCRCWLRRVKGPRPATKRYTMCPFMNRVQRLGGPRGRAESSGRSLP